MPNNSSHLEIITEVFGLGRLPNAIRESLLEEIDELVFRSVLFQIMVDMDEEDKNELNDVLENAGEDFEKPFAFLKEKVKNLDTIIRDEVLRIKEESFGMMESFA